MHDPAEQIDDLIYVPNPDYPYPFPTPQPPHFWMTEQTANCRALSSAISVASGYRRRICGCCNRICASMWRVR